MAACDAGVWLSAEGSDSEWSGPEDQVALLPWARPAAAGDRAAASRCRAGVGSLALASTLLATASAVAWRWPMGAAGHGMAKIRRQPSSGGPQPDSVGLSAMHAVARNAGARHFQRWSELLQTTTTAPASASNASGTAADAAKFTADGSLGPHAPVQVQRTTCYDTSGWTDGNSNCGGPGCTSSGYTCEAYEAKKWCYQGHELQIPSVEGSDLNEPTKNCCACGGGSFTAESFQAAGMDSTLCSMRTGCLGQEGSCCPGPDGKYQECCLSEPVCEDTSGWANGWTMCAMGIHENRDDACTPAGLTCEGYARAGLCSGGAGVKGFEWTLGSSYNSPERNCCVCGKEHAAQGHNSSGSPTDENSSMRH